MPPGLLLGSAFLLVAIALALLAGLQIRAGYREFLALGPGGTPSNFAGFIRVKFLAQFELRNRYVPGPVPRDSKWSCLTALPLRSRPRPLTKGIAPHRQTDQRPSQKVFVKLAACIERIAQGNSTDLAIGTSCFEKHGTGLFSKSPATKTCRGEIVHLHGSDGSMHLTLHPSDAKVVLEAGWGERHPLAGVFKRWFLPQLPVGFVMLYAPQNDEEIEIVLEVIGAAAAFVHGQVTGFAKGFEGGHAGKQQLGLDRCCEVAVNAARLVSTE
ncbi:hypothetical protein M409DRAFT_16891 [Zasmidium cellare ATCC 36951]|uniref:Luciferase domain-containing protein n=1 Tax=Zasmidium cellare ATCC 36951 TaxID=1080233 RepID=A0A6A6D3G5_ZASCE|nr:uncharacterized protein M409DRAFT_16891 [Zasmidium cellare ATCC 36951]KAF2172940.1 hypothetical protein M409DRAFT_16891 [Zasmidium cellare ATCC 36951]